MERYYARQYSLAVEASWVPVIVSTYILISTSCLCEPALATAIWTVPQITLFPVYCPLLHRQIFLPHSGRVQSLDRAARISALTLSDDPTQARTLCQDAHVPWPRVSDVTLSMDL